MTVQGDADVSFMAMADPDAWEAGFGDVVETVYESLDIKVEETAADGGFTTITDNEDVISVSVPGVTIYTIENDDYSTTAYLDYFDLSEQCEFAGRKKFSENGLRGHYDLWSSCGRNNALYFSMAVTSEDDAFIELQVTVVEEADLDTLEIILDSLTVEIP